jgi:hypothetical protein
MIVRQTTNKSYVIFAAGPLTVKHMIFYDAMKNLPVAANRLFARNGRVSAPRHCAALRAFKTPRGGMATLARPM